MTDSGHLHHQRHGAGGRLSAVRSPGVIFQPGRDAKTIVTGTVHPYRGEWIEFDVEAKPGKDISAGSRVARKRRLSLFTPLRALGYADEAFLERFVRHFEFLEPQWDAERKQQVAPTQEAALLEMTSALARVNRPRSNRPVLTSKMPSSTPSVTT